MCPACITSAALIAAGVTSAGGLSAWVAHKLHLQSAAKASERNIQTEGAQNGPSESGVPS
jgi:hypothetical protein